MIMRRLPQDLLAEIQARLQPEEAAAFSATSSQSRASMRNPRYWAEKLQRHFPESYEPARHLPLDSSQYEIEYQYAYRFVYAGLTPAQKRLFNAVKDAAGQGEGYQIPPVLAALRASDLDNLSDARGTSLLEWVVQSRNPVLNNFCFDLVSQSLQMDPFNRTALHWAFTFSQTNEVIGAIIAGDAAEIDALTHEGLSALCLAVMTGREDIARLLLERGANIDIVNPNDGSTLLHRLIGDGDFGGVQFLLRHRARLDLVNNDAFNPLMHAVKLKRDHIVDAILAKLERRLRSAPAASMTQVNNEVRDQYTLAMISAVFVQDMFSLEKLFHLSAEPDVNYVVEGDNSSTALHYAAGDGNLDMVTFLLDKGALVDERLANGPTPLYLAASRGHEAVARLLLVNGAALMPVVSVAINRNQPEGVACLLAGAAEADRVRVATYVMFRAITENKPAILRVALEAGASVNYGGGNCRGVLHHAAHLGHIQIATILIAHGANVNAKESTHATPLHYAARKGNADMVDSLLANGADVNATLASGGQTPSALAVGKADILALLAAAKSEPPQRKKARLSNDAENGASASPSKEKAVKRDASKAGLFSPSPSKSNKRQPREPESPQTGL
jgi:ankyrin repeat protein